MDAKLESVEQRIAVLTQKYAELQAAINKQGTTGASNGAEDPKDAEIAQLKKENAKLQYRIDFLVRELQTELAKNKK